MSQYRVSDSARSDLDEIWLYIARDNPDAADKFIRSLVSRFPMLASSPEIGRERKELSSHLRSFAIGNYVIFYRPMKTVSKSRACCTEQEIFRRCLNDATMEVDPTRAYNQDDATGFIRLNAPRLKIAAKSQKT